MLWLCERRNSFQSYWMCPRRACMSWCDRMSCRLYNPFVVLAPEPYVHRYVELHPGNAECVLPISPRRAILFSNIITGGSVLKLSRQCMASWVKQIVSFGYETVFASISADYIQQEFDRIPAGAITKVPVWTIPLPPLPPVPRK